MAWLMLGGAIASEVIATSALKLSNGFTRLIPSLVVIVGYLVSFVMLGQALRLHMPVSIAYAIWSGVGTAAIAVIAMVLLDEPLTPVKVAGILLVIVGVVVLSLAGVH